ncbi:hypothetical protein EV182_004161 [Spiromyces aspiralis]|uniref:Uncharacterized protein n=1 Tax=Spiromyces aspiralis TaxID=68401 RepID=A0ACC1HCD0_9FUNG|nr:hypothetical protein EV182_004161 [Spiromyces aspiralis]
MSNPPSNHGVVYMVAAIASIGGFLYGYDQGNMSEILQMKRFNSYFNEPDSLHQSIITSMLTLGCFIGSLAAAPLSDAVGRKYTIVIGSCIFVVGSALQCGSINQGMLIASRIIGGLGVGVLSMIVPLFQTEIAPPEIRGRLVSLQQFAITIGILCSYWITYGCSKIHGTASFRLPLGIQIVPALILVPLILIMPFSPRWLVSKDRDDEAIQVLARLRAHGDVNAPHVVEEYNDIKSKIQEERESVDNSYIHIYTGRLRRRIILGMGIQCLQQLTGINAIMYYAPKIFKQAGMSGDSAPLIAQGLNGALNVLCTIPAILWLDKIGRRKVMLGGALSMAIWYAIVAGLMKQYGTPYRDGADMNMSFANKAASKGVIAGLYLFVASFAASWGPVAWVYCAEIFPNGVRAKATSITTATNWLFNFGVATITPVAMERITWGVYLLYCCFNACALIATYLFYPETKNVKLEDMDEVFAQSIWAFKIRRPDASRSRKAEMSISSNEKGGEFASL